MSSPAASSLGVMHMGAGLGRRHMACVSEWASCLLGSMLQEVADA